MSSHSEWLDRLRPSRTHGKSHDAPSTWSSQSQLRAAPPLHSRSMHSRCDALVGEPDLPRSTRSPSITIPISRDEKNALGVPEYSSLCLPRGVLLTSNAISSKHCRVPGQIPPAVRQSRSSSADVGRMWPNIGRVRHHLGRNRPNIVWPRLGPTSGESGVISPAEWASTRSWPLFQPLLTPLRRGHKPCV